MKCLPPDCGPVLGKTVFNSGEMFSKLGQLGEINQISQNFNRVCV